LELENPDSEATKLIRVEIQKALDEDRSEAGDIGKHSQSQRNHEQNLAEMTPAELSAIIDRWEGEKTAITRDITPV